MDNSANLIVDVLENAGEAATGFAGVMGDAFTGVGSMFWTSTGPTMLGALSMIAVGVTVVYFAFRLIKRLIRTR